MQVTYDAFLSYSRTDAVDVRRVYEYLSDRGLKLWFDAETLPPGSDWLEEMQSGLGAARTCIVFYRAEPGPWNQEEVKQALRQRADNPLFKIIPVLLPGSASDTPKLPPILKGSTWVDLRSGLFDIPALRKLAQAVSGNASVPIHPVPQGARDDRGLPTGYRADVGKIISLLVGESLYNQRYVCIREIIQNSVDACERRAKASLGFRPEIGIIVDSDEGYFDVIDNGEGMNPYLLAECFAVVGKSIKDEDNVLERTQASESTRLYLIGRFGIGFISTYILAKKVLLSTTAHGDQQINIEITGITDPFVYHQVSPVGRPPLSTGTTIRVYLKDEFRKTGKSSLDIWAAVKQYCRHVPYLQTMKDGQHDRAEDWNVDKHCVTDATTEPYRFDLRLGISDGTASFVASNGGFLISDRPDAITPVLMPPFIGGEINLFPNVVDLNISRDAIMDNEKARKVRSAVGVGIKKLLVRVVSSRAAISDEVRKSLVDLLKVYVVQASDAEQKIALGQKVADVPPLSFAESADLLVEMWLVRWQGKDVPLREALQKARAGNKNRVYWYRWYLDVPILKLFKENLIRRGFVVLSEDYSRVAFRNGESRIGESAAALRHLARRFNFQALSVEEPLEADMEGIIVNTDQIAPALRDVIGDIRKSGGRNVRVGRLRDAPAAFKLGPYDYLNLDNEVLRKVDASAKQHEYRSLRSYVLGLLQYELKETPPASRN